MSASEPAWHLHNRTARLAASHVLHAKFDTHLPHAGLRDVTWQESFRIDRLFGLTKMSAKTIPPAETYVRQPDLIVHYSADPDDHVARSLYWRASATSESDENVQAESLQIELLLSLSTATLDSHPVNELRTEFTEFDGEVFVADTWGGWQALATTELPAAGEQPAWQAKQATIDAVDQGPARATGNGRVPSEGVVLIRPTHQECSIALAVCPSDLEAWQLNFDKESQRLTASFQLAEEFLEKGVIRRFRAACSFWPRSADRALAHRWFQRFAQSSPPLTT